MIAVWSLRLTGMKRQENWLDEMANPQKENGSFPIANEIAEALMRINISPYENRVLWVVLRQTYGWKKKEDYISFSQIGKKTGLDRRLAARGMKGMRWQIELTS